MPQSISYRVVLCGEKKARMGMGRGAGREKGEGRSADGPVGVRVS
jgi:hypothetical protein